MKTVKDLFDCWDSVPEMAADVGGPHNTWSVAKWKQRKRIPASAWPALIKALKRKGKDIGAAELLAMHTGSKRSPVVQKNDRSDAA